MIRRWFRFIALLLGMIACVPLHYAWKLVGAKSPWPRRFLFWVGYVAGIRLEVRGSYRRTNILFVANHATWLDIMIIGGTTGAAFVAKEELKTSKFVHWMAGLNDSIWIQRSDRTGIHGQVDVIRKVLESGRAVCFFPEATTKGGKDVLPFRASLFSALYPPIPGLVVQPIAIDYGANNGLVAWGDESGGAVVNRVFSHKGTIPTRMTFSEPLDPAQMDRKRMAIVSRQAIVDALNASDAPEPSLYPAQ
ncbi:MAG TPA: lysophospholipid acyltransferase family protein [Allosphingosinicella sp.]|jgi:1-acyl-sn-glycerol-3-phosphate acyltransferase